MKRETEQIVKEIEEVLPIDLDRLEIEWSQQALRYFRLAVDAERADAEAERAKIAYDVAKEEVKEVEARLSVSVRADPAAFNVSKVTEGSIEAAVLSHPSYARAVAKRTAASNDWVDAKEYAGVLKVGVQSMEHKKKGLEKGVDMLLAGIFAAPCQPRAEDDRRAFEEHGRANSRRPQKSKG